MAAAVQVRFRGMKPNPSIESAVERWVGRLETVCPIERCVVAISRSLLDTSGARVAVDVWFEGSDGIEDRCESRAEHSDVYVAVSNAFRDSYRHINAEHGCSVRPAAPLRGRSLIADRAEPAHREFSVSTLLDLPVPA